MKGVITAREVLQNAGLILQEFGPLCLLRCLSALVCTKQTTFLEIAFRNWGCSRPLPTCPKVNSWPEIPARHSCSASICFPNRWRSNPNFRARSI